jgi:hypothetical protein
MRGAREGILDAVERREGWIQEAIQGAHQTESYDSIWRIDPMNQVNTGVLQGNLPAKAQTGTGVFGFLFDLLDLLTAVFSLFDLLGELFGPGTPA